MRPCSRQASHGPKELHRAVEAVGMEESLHAGDLLNQLLRANAQLAPIFEQVGQTRERLKREVEERGA